jgi:hypothetical protein
MSRRRSSATTSPTRPLPETGKLWALFCTWWSPIEVLVVTGVSNAKSDAANTSIKNIKRVARGFRNADQYRGRFPAHQCQPEARHETHIKQNRRIHAMSGSAPYSFARNPSAVGYFASLRRLATILRTASTTSLPWSSTPSKYVAITVASSLSGRRPSSRAIHSS